MSIAQLLVDAGGCGIRACLVHEDAQENRFPIIRAIGSNGKLHLVFVVVIVLVVVVVSVRILVALLIQPVVKGILIVVFELSTCNSLLQIKVEVSVLAVVVVVVVAPFLLAGKSCICVASATTILQLL